MTIAGPVTLPKTYYPRRTTGNLHAGFRKPPPQQYFNSTGGAAVFLHHHWPMRRAAALHRDKDKAPSPDLTVTRLHFSFLFSSFDAFAVEKPQPMIRTVGGEGLAMSRLVHLLNRPSLPKAPALGEFLRAVRWCSRGPRPEATLGASRQRNANPGQ